MSHPILAFNAVAAKAERTSEAAIEAMVRKREVPPKFGVATADPLYASNPVLFRRTSRSARLTVFDGGHDIVHEAGLTWLEAQRRRAPAAHDIVAGCTE